MAENPTVLFVQNRTHRAGAQTALARLLQHEAMRQWNPVLLCSPGGWLAEECARLGVPVIEEPFPSSRSLPARMLANSLFVRRVVRRLTSKSVRPAIVHSNDHMEGLLGLALARRLGARSAIFLRSSAMSRRDYKKYRCDRFEFIGAVSENFRQRVQAWDGDNEIALVPDGIFADEIRPAKTKPASPPRRLLVIGSLLALKGWADMYAALYKLEQAGAIPELQVDFTGKQPDPAAGDANLSGLRKTRCNFIGRVEAFRDLVLSYDLVVNPSRMETFGLAAIEVLAAGVPLLSSRSGVMDQVQESQDMLFAPGRPDELATALRKVLEQWQTIDFGVERAQENMRRRFLIDDSAARLSEAYGRLTGAG